MLYGAVRWLGRRCTIPILTYISRFQVLNYKSFLNPNPVVFTPGFNIISGQNNAGKTALLEALGLDFNWNPHRSLKSIPEVGIAPGQLSIADISCTITPAEVHRLMRSLPGGLELQLFKPQLDSSFARQVGFVDDSRESAQKLLDAVFAQSELTITIRFQADSSGNMQLLVAESASSRLYRPQGQANAWRTVSFRAKTAGGFEPTGGAEPVTTDFGYQFAQYFFKQNIFRFSAERLNIGSSGHGTSRQLARNASNLPEVLNQLQHNVARFRDLNNRLREILPQVRMTSVRPSQPGQNEIVVWCHDPESRREDLTIPLADSGTGIGQVLAILYVVLTSDRPQTIIIDEPQSFLHPGAARKLVEFLKLHQQHQFIIATHSATIISAANPKTITLATFDNSETMLQQLDVKAESGIQKTLIELGIRLGDVFGADKILWLEGRTEEKCFPLIIEKLMHLPLMGIEILGIRQTGDLEGRDARKVFEIYRSLTKGASLLPPAVAFILDDEGRDEAAKRELSHLSGNLARFLPRRMYENYLLNAKAIAETVNLIDNSRPDPLTPDKISAALETRLNTPRYFRAQLKTLDDRIRNVDAATVLSEIFSEFSETRVTYQKVLHGVALTEWLIKNEPEELREVVEMLAGVLKTE